MQNLLSTDVVSEKFVLREVILFFIMKRREVLGDKNILISFNKLIEFIDQYKGVSISKIDVIKYMNYLESFTKRNKIGIEIEPRSKLLNYKSNKISITIKNCTTNDLYNALSYIDKSIYLKSRPKEYKDKSFFSLTQDGKIKFIDKETKQSLEIKERAIFNFLRRNFKEECNYLELFEKADSQQGGSNKSLRIENNTEKKQKVYIDNGITQLRIKLFELCNNKKVIKKVEGKKYTYKLIY